MENLILTDLLAWRDSQTPQPQILYWRTASDHEVDFVIEHQRRLLPIEVKASTRPGHRDIRHLLTFLQDYPEQVPGALLLHAGHEVFWMATNVLAAPWWQVL